MHRYNDTAIKCIIPLLSPLARIISLSRCSPSNDHETTTIAIVARRLLVPLAMPAATSCMRHAIYRCTPSIRGQKRGPPQGRLPYSLPLFKAHRRTTSGELEDYVRDLHQSNAQRQFGACARASRCITRHRVHFVTINLDQNRLKFAL